MGNKVISLTEDQIQSFISLFGMNDQYLLLIQDQLNVRISLKENDLIISGEEKEVQQAGQTLEAVFRRVRSGESIDRSQIIYIMDLIRNNSSDLIEEELNRTITTTYRGKPIRIKTPGQKEYIDLIRNRTITFAIGPAGTGKTYLAMAMAVIALKNREIERIILTRPAVEAGEKLGFLPGDMAQKVDPYLRPLYDAIHAFLGPDTCIRMLEKGTIEVAPLAYMRGRTLSNAFVILDEAQNTTTEQMKMFLTRLGFGSKMVITGDITQTDLPPGKKSGLTETLHILDRIPEVGIVELTDRDIVRHDLVQKIVKAYENHEKRLS